MKVTNGYGMDLGEEYLANFLFDYLTFDEAALLINNTWTRQHLHKEKKQNRIFPSMLLVVEDEELFPKALGAGAKKFFIHKDEVQRLKEDYAGRPKRQISRCPFCERPAASCKRKPCKVRVEESRDFKQSIETVAEFFSRFLVRNPEGQQSLERLHRRQEEKRRLDTQRRTQKRDNETDSGGDAESGRPDTVGEDRRDWDSFDNELLFD